jgi:hypothetical protein
MGPTVKGWEEERGYASFRVAETKCVVSAGECAELLEAGQMRMKEMRMGSCCRSRTRKKGMVTMRALLDTKPIMWNHEKSEPRK